VGLKRVEKMEEIPKDRERRSQPPFDKLSPMITQADSCSLVKNDHEKPKKINKCSKVKYLPQIKFVNLNYKCLNITINLKVLRLNDEFHSSD